MQSYRIAYTTFVRKGTNAMIIRPYRSIDETGWLRCRVLAFLDTAYFDHVIRTKDKYENPSIELVAETDGMIVGLIDVELEKSPGTLTTGTDVLSGMIWHLAVHPDYRKQGIGVSLLKEVERTASTLGITRIEVWTRDDDWVLDWYDKKQFHKRHSYLHVFMEGKNELKGHLESKAPHLFPVAAFAHYVGPDVTAVKQRFQRVHECIMLEKILNHEPFTSLL